MITRPTPYNIYIYLYAYVCVSTYIIRTLVPPAAAAASGVKLSIDGKYNKSVSSMLRRVCVRGPREKRTSCRERGGEREGERERVCE